MTNNSTTADKVDPRAALKAIRDQAAMSRLLSKLLKEGRLSTVLP